ncbi:hypothetical protein Lal_00018701 [Lupinus albus]|nr:hypothetical protein Lal_00018701 [Lupinus albus]
MRIGLHNVSGPNFVECGLINDFRVDELRFMQVDVSQAQQLLYVSDPTDMKWFIFLLTNKIIVNNFDDQE